MLGNMERRSGVTKVRRKGCGNSVTLMVDEGQLLEIGIILTARAVLTLFYLIRLQEYFSIVNSV